MKNMDNFQLTWFACLLTKHKTEAKNTTRRTGKGSFSVQKRLHSLLVYLGHKLTEGHKTMKMSLSNGHLQYKGNFH